MSLLKHRQVFLSAILAVLVSAGCALSPQAKETRALANGKRFLDKKDYPRAVLEFRNAVAAMPRDPEAYYRLGLAFAGNRDLQPAVNSFRKTLELDPKHVRAQVELAGIMASTLNPNLLQEAEKRLMGLLQEGLTDAGALNSLALAELKLGKIDTAIGRLEQALGMAPQALQSSILLAQVKLSQRDFKGAEQVLQTACASAPGSSPPRVILGQFYISRNLLPEAERQFQQALALDPNSATALMELGRLQQYLGRKPEAERTFKRLSALPVQSSKPAHAIFLLQEGRNEEAIRELERLANESPDDRAARTRLVAAYLSAGRKPDAQRVLAAALKRSGKDLDALLQRGEIYLQDGNYRSAEADLNAVLRQQPDAAEVHYILSKLHRARGSVLLQRQELAEALRLNPALLVVRLELAQLLLQNKGAQPALEVLDEAPPYQRQTLALAIQRNWALWTLGDWNGFRRGVDAGLQTQRAPGLLVQDGLWKLRSGDPAGARKVLEEALRLDPADLRALQVLKDTYLAQKQAPVALQKVKEYAAQRPESAPVQEFLGLMLLGSGNRTEARQAFTAAKTADPHYSKSDLSLVQLDVLEGKVDDAHRKLQSIVASDSGNVTAQRWLGNLEVVRGNHTGAIEQFRKVVAANPADAQAANNLAYLLTEYQKKPDEALKYAQKAIEIAPENSAYCDTLGWALYQQGLYRSAIPYLERASTNKGNLAWKYHLAMAYARAGDGAHGRAVLEAALKLDPNVPEARAAREVVQAAR
jgi:tetratricopeptide (TPR) repeat protein